MGECMHTQSDPVIAREAVQKNVEQEIKERIKKILEEFFLAQAVFHYKTRDFVAACDTASINLPDDQRESFEKFLEPYRVLVNNPFPMKGSGDVDQDVELIFSIIAKRDRQFTKAFVAQIAATISFLDFDKFLSNLSVYPEVLRKIIASFDTSSKEWSELKERATLQHKPIASNETKTITELHHRVAMPFQNSMRYKLFLVTLLDQLNKSDRKDYDSAQLKLREIVTETITSLQSDLTILGEFQDVCTLLADIAKIMKPKAQPAQDSPSAAVAACAQTTKSDEAMFMTEQDRYDGLSVHTKIDAVRAYVDNAMLLIARGDFDMLNIKKGLLLLLQQLQEGMNESLASERALAWKRDSYMAQISQLYSYYVTGEEKDPRERLALLINDISIYVMKPLFTPALIDEQVLENLMAAAFKPTHQTASVSAPPEQNIATENVTEQRTPEIIGLPARRF